MKLRISYEMWARELVGVLNLLSFWSDWITSNFEDVMVGCRELAVCHGSLRPFTFHFVSTHPETANQLINTRLAYMMVL